MSMDHGTRYSNWVTMSELPGVTSSGGTRYRDPLVRRNINDVANPEHRILLSQNNPIAHRYTGMFLGKMLAKDLSFASGPKPTDELHEFNDELVAFFKNNELYDYIYRAAMNHLVHGWQVTIPEVEWLDPSDPSKGALSVDLHRCYSEYEVPVAQMRRYTRWEVAQMRAQWNAQVRQLAAAGKPVPPPPKIPRVNDIKYFRVAFHPLLPLWRNKTGMQQELYGVFPASQVFHTYHMTWNYGLGVSELGEAWDPIIKLGEVSENNHFRQSLVMDAIFHPNWSLDDANDYIRRMVYAINNKQIVGRWPYQDDQGRLDPNVPSISFLNAVRDNTPTKQNEGGAQGLSDLTSPWAYLSAATGYTTRYWLGNPGGALAAASVDDLNDVVNDITRFGRIIKYLVEPLLEFLQQLQLIPGEINLSTVHVKSWLQMEFETEYLRKVGASQGGLLDANHNSIPDALEGGQRPPGGEQPTKEQKVPKEEKAPPPEVKGGAPERRENEFPGEWIGVPGDEVDVEGDETEGGIEVVPLIEIDWGNVE